MTGKISFRKRLSRMLRVDLGRLAKSRLFYIIIASALLVPVLMTVMMSMMDGSVSTDPTTGIETVMRGPENTWQNIGTLPGGEAMGGADIFAMCNINMCFMAVAVFVCLFISEDFRCGFAKNLFAVRADRTEYVVSKTAVGILVGALMLIAYFLGSALGGAVSGLSFETVGFGGLNLFFCILSKIFLMPVFVSIFTLVSVAAKSRAWLSLTVSFGGGMLLFMTVSLITPLTATLINALLCLAFGIIFATGLGLVSRKIIRSTSVV